MALCSCNTQFGLAYGVSLTGDGDGQFEVTFPQGSYAMDGTATIDLNVGDTVPFGKVTTKAEVLERGNAKEIAALRAANDSVAIQFKATSGSGTYDLWLHGFIQEIGTGLVFEVDRHFTNRETKTPLRTPSNDPYPYIK
jgi:hypothetical protein